MIVSRDDFKNNTKRKNYDTFSLDPVVLNWPANLTLTLETLQFSL